ncbi:EscU/YscU/HrcU family type III secretion system export apparatus switch protein [Caenibacillus caldisaponilyticus]|uniref:EscU/YscU/HrcU family type III secretion system export apparatus switch protein n=1 Tax=Caenibacillus caldisaponilyticus TaxID=1674942 RepID=UPI0009884B0D|nr:EscU/YscU/HrcU family type III secretion system export apparatus switch protein [Caenibacillus caldisaponilyticus]
MKASEQVKRAVALRYQADRDEAPKVVAKGTLETAKKIIETAKAHHIPIQEDETLVALLIQLDIGEAIPPELYQAVAEIFSFIYQLDKNYGNPMPPRRPE